ncbi:uncharacterized protein LOC143485201 [Brachyhypopomus gauderio]|uniref:uncharacterized protein LOC143485201 n=1 Tax=Brachyhypopomus gauderio TaxID=698409 RepID=UPI0040434406
MMAELCRKSFGNSTAARSSRWIHFIRRRVPTRTFHDSVQPSPVTSAQPPPVTSVQPSPVTSAQPPPVTSAQPPPVTSAQPPPVTSAQPPPVTSAQPPPVPIQSPSEPSAQQMAVDVHNIPGMERVDELSEYLVELRTQTRLTLTNQQTTTIVSLWQNLNQFDKNRLVYAARHQDRLLTARFRSPKKKAVFTPGVESTKRCVLGSSGSPAQWPDCCRLIKTIFVRLANIHRSPTTQVK